MTVTSLTPEQLVTLASRRTLYYNRAISTTAASRTAAEGYAATLAARAGITSSQTVVWANSPTLCAAAYDAAWAALGVNLRTKIGATLSDAVWAGLLATLKESWRAELRSSLGSEITSECWDTYLDTAVESVRSQVWAATSESLDASLYSSLSSTDRDSLNDAFWSSVFGMSGGESTAWDVGLVAFYEFGVDTLGMGPSLSEAASEVFSCMDYLSNTCFGVWIAPGTTVLCERPATVTVSSGNVTAMTWRT